MLGKRSPHITDDTEAAWRFYMDTLEEVRRDVLSLDLNRDPMIRAQALYFLQMHQQTAFAKYLAPRQAYPNLNIHLEFMPFELTTGQSNPDFLYRWTYLDGTRTYRMWGRLGTTRWTDIQVSNGHWGDTTMEPLGNYTLEDFKADPDGAYEIVFSADPRPGNWIRLDRNARNNTVLIRETWCDWENERGVEMHIEAVGLRGDEPTVYDEAEFNQRLRAAARFMRYSADFSIRTTRRILDSARPNTFPPAPEPDPNRPRVGGSNPQGNFQFMAYDIRPDEALIIETAPPKARYWGISLGDVWFASIDYTYHHSSLNDAQAVVDSDGKIRFVLAHEDPGVANWLDVVGSGFGVVLFRRYLVEAPTVPETKLVKLAELRGALPPDTATMPPAERRAVVERRKRASLARYGF